MLGKAELSKKRYQILLKSSSGPVDVFLVSLQGNNGTHGPKDSSHQRKTCLHGQFSKTTDEILLNKQEPGETGSTRFETGSDALVLNAHDIFHLETCESVWL